MINNHYTEEAYVCFVEIESRLLAFEFYRTVAWNRRFRIPVGGCAVIGGNIALQREIGGIWCARQDSNLWPPD